MERSNLTLAERFILSDPNSSDGLMALRLTLVEWAVRGYVTLESKVKQASGQRIVTGQPASVEIGILLNERWDTLPLTGHEVRLRHLWHGVLKKQTSYPLSLLGIGLREVFGAEYSGILTDEIYPALVNKGALRLETHRRFLRSETVRVPTVSGVVEQVQERDVALGLLLTEIAHDAENLDVLAALAVRAGDALLSTRELDRHLFLITKAVRARAPQWADFVPYLETTARYGKQIEKALSTRSGVSDISKAPHSRSF